MFPENVDAAVDDVLILLMMMYTAAATVLLTSKTRKQRRWWVRPIYQKRIQQGDYHNLMREMRLSDCEMFFHYTRLSVEQFDNLLTIVGPHIAKKSNREPLGADQRLAITLRFLATGCSFQTLAFQFRIGKATACNIVHETSQAIWDSLHKKVFVKATSENWLKIAKDFENRWNFPHCIGALDGKHVRIQAPPLSGTEYYNYKQFFSVILMAMCDANYKFTFVDIGGTGSESDGGVFGRSNFAKLLESKQLHLPSPAEIGGFSNCLFPYFIVADEAFPLKENIMRPYPGKFLNKSQTIFNYRLSRARRIIENTFGILVSRWRLFQGPIIARVENVDKYIEATVCLHNYLKIWEECNPKSTQKYCPPNYIDNYINGNLQLGEWRQNIYNSQAMQAMGRLGSNNAKQKYFEIRNEMANYFLSDEGAVPWQDTYIKRGTKRQREN